jgi:hypothetical protein
LNGEPADVDRDCGMSIRGRPEPALHAGEPSGPWTRIDQRLSQKVLIDSSKNFIACWRLNELSRTQATATYYATFDGICSIDKHDYRSHRVVVLPEPGSNR